MSGLIGFSFTSFFSPYYRNMSVYKQLLVSQDMQERFLGGFAPVSVPMIIRVFVVIAV